MSCLLHGRHAWTLLLCSILVQGCGTFGDGRSDSIRLGDGSVFFGSSASNPAVHAALMAQYREWKGTPYQLGGNSKRGIDCSAFVQQTLSTRFGINVPRSTAAQVDVGTQVRQGEMQLGDLVFFRTGYNSRHVGIYMGNGQFLHASTRDGVVVGDLNQAYWRKAFWTVRRVM